VTAPEEGIFCNSAGRIRFLLGLSAPGKSSENMGAVRGEEPSPLLECSLLEVVDAVSEMVSLLDAGLFLLIRSSICGSMASRLMFSQPFCILTLASARRSWRARVICVKSDQRLHMPRSGKQYLLTLDTCALRITFLATSSGRPTSYCAAMVKKGGPASFSLSRGHPTLQTLREDPFE
jgi:hypothetical protein